MDYEITAGWVLIGIALLTAWVEIPVCILYVTVIALMIRRVLRENDPVKFEQATLLLLAGNTAFMITLIIAAVVGGHQEIK